jgi:adenylate cyclase, class 2
MEQTTRPIENEIKIRIRDAEAGRRLLLGAGFAESKPRVFEQNEVFDTPDASLRSHGALLRVRSAGSQGVLTWKGPTLPGRHRAREEREVNVSDADTMKFILGMIGFVSVFRYEKFRTEFRREQDDLLVLLDETPIGCFLELEGGEGVVDSVASELGYCPEDYITASYGALYEEDCNLRGIAPTNFVFDF